MVAGRPGQAVVEGVPDLSLVGFDVDFVAIGQAGVGIGAGKWVDVGVVIRAAAAGVPWESRRRAGRAIAVFPAASTIAAACLA